MRRATHCASSVSPGATYDHLHADRPLVVERRGPATRLRGTIPGASVEHGLDGAQNLRRGCGSCRSSSTRRPPRALDFVAVLREALRLGVAESEDRLVDVADGVEAAGAAGSAEEPRLLAVGVLKLVHQDVVELRLQARPRLRAVLQQPHGELFEVGEIERRRPAACASRYRRSKRRRISNSSARCGRVDAR